MEDKILENSLNQIDNHKGRNDVFETFCSLLYKSIYQENPPKNNPNALGIKRERIQSSIEKRTVGDLYLLKENMPATHYRKNLNSDGLDNPIVVVKYHGRERIIDGSNCINYWFRKGDQTKLFDINLHEIMND